MFPSSRHLAREFLRSESPDDKLHVTHDLETGMTVESKAKPIREKVREHRDRLRALGLRPIQIWVPDVRSPSFRKQAHRQSREVAASDHAREDQAFIDVASDWVAD